MEFKGLYTKGEEVFNAVSHGAGILLAVVGTAVMITLAAVYYNWVAVVSSVIYGFSLIVMYTMSTLYHAIPYPRAKRVMQILDHDSIYFLIAGTYTPITLITLQDSPRRFLIFTAVWIAAITGTVLNGVDLGRFKKASLVLYILMGWAAVVDFVPIIKGLGASGFMLLLIGGLFYTGGIVFYKMKQTRFMHGVWHLFVVAGSVFHYFCILFYVLPEA